MLAAGDFMCAHGLWYPGLLGSGLILMLKGTVNEMKEMETKWNEIGMKISKLISRMPAYSEYRFTN